MAERTLLGLRRERLEAVWEDLRTSFWFVPSAMALLALVLLFGVRAADALLFSDAAGGRRPWFIYVSTPADAREVLSTLLSSMFTTVALVFSITMVVLTLAANQFGPRLIRSFMAAPQTQVVLGAFVMTIVYCLLVLVSIGSRAEAGRSAFSGVSVAVVLALLSIGLLVFFLHTLARSIVSETVIERVGRELDELIDGLEPIRPGDEEARPEQSLPPDFHEGAAVLGPDKSGYVKAIEFEKLLQLAEASDTMVGLYFRAGDYVVEGGRGIAIYPASRSGELAAAVKNAVLIGPHRTPIQDLEFSIRHLVEIAVRALSPGINDPFTAIAVIARLSASFSRFFHRQLPTGVIRDSRGVARVISPAPTYSSVIGAAFHQIRQNGADKPVVVIHLLEGITRMAEHVSSRAQREALEQQIGMIADAGERSIDDPPDRAEIKKRREEASRAMDHFARQF